MTHDNRTGFATAVKRHAEGIDPAWPFASEFVNHAKALAELWRKHAFDKAAPALVIAVPEDMRGTLADYFKATLDKHDVHAIGRDYVAVNHAGVFVKFSPLEHIVEEHRHDPTPTNVCPLPKVGEWRWEPQHGCESLLVADDGGSWQLSAWKDVSGKWWDWSVGFSDDGPQVDGMCRTRKGAQRAAEKAAIRAWKVRNP